MDFYIIVKFLVLVNRRERLFEFWIVVVEGVIVVGSFLNFSCIFSFFFKVMINNMFMVVF